ncbi:MAG: hypothetical protein Crog4KO_22260 [Crocinitomicaceae bacterium]
MKSGVLIILLLLLLPLSSYAQEEDTTIYDFPDVEAQFPGGQVALMKYVTNNIVYPDSLIDMDFQSKFYFSFVVEKDGSLTDIKVERGMGSGYAEDLLAFIQKMPNWIPGELDGEAVRTRCRLPILLCPLH